MGIVRLPFLAGHPGEVKCRHCGSTNARVSSLSSGSSDHVTYRCNDCKRHFRVHAAPGKKRNLAATGAFFVLLLASAGIFLYFATDSGDRTSGSVEYQPTVNLQSQEALAKARQSAGQGNAQSQYDLGWAHWQRGEYLEALPWIKAAAAQGHAEAEYMLGMAYLEGHGIVQNYRTAFEHLTRAAQHAHLEAQYRLGLLYRDGQGTQADKESAYVWLNVAAARGHDDALQHRDKLAIAMGRDEINRAQEASARTLAQLGGEAGKGR